MNVKQGQLSAAFAFYGHVFRIGMQHKEEMSSAARSINHTSSEQRNF